MSKTKWGKWIYIILLTTLLNISISNMACEMCELCEFLPKLRGSIELQLTDNLTDPCQIEQISQPEPIILDGLLVHGL